MPPRAASTSCRLVATFALLLSFVCTTACTEHGDEVVPVGDDAGALANAVLPVGEITLKVAGLTSGSVTLRLGLSDEYAAHVDGVYQVALTTLTRDVNPIVLAQPSGLRCTIDAVDARTFALTCVPATHRLGGTVSGLVGTGLTLTSQTGETLAIAADGPFVFTQGTVEGASYAVTVSGNVTAPHQSCMVSNAVGTAQDADVNVQVACATKSYSLYAEVSGLSGDGLQLAFAAGDLTQVAAPGTMHYATALPDGYAYAVTIAQQPTGDQLCFVQDGRGAIDGADVTVHVTCDRVGGLRITEVGACPFSNFACWFEIVNLKEDRKPEQLGFYKVRTTAVGPKAFEKEHEFQLPELTVPYLGRVIVQGRTTSALPDGSYVVHVEDGDVLPYWTSDGFVELLANDDRTIDFVRFGKNTMEPRVIGTWAIDPTATAAPAMPSGSSAYGWSIVHVEPTRPVSHPGDWQLRAFSTYGGANDVTSDVDADVDGIPDDSERAGETFSGVDVYAMGACPGRRDVFVEIDHMDSADLGLTPRKEALDKLVAVFAARGIAMHFDVGSLYSRTFNPALYNLGGGNVVPFSKGIAFGETTSGTVDFYELKAQHLAAQRRGFFYYQIFAWSQRADGKRGSSGIGEVFGNDSMITLGGYTWSTASNAATNTLINTQAVSMMHELGHNFGLRHGGDDEVNQKPNYVSVMNYLYSPLGLPTIGTAEGDRYGIYAKCSSNLDALTNPLKGDSASFVIDYSDGRSADLDEAAVYEAEGLGRWESRGVDYDCSGSIDGRAYARDLNLDGEVDQLRDHDDWRALTFVFRRSPAGNLNGAPLEFLNPSGTRADVHTADAAQDTSTPCGAFAFESENASAL